MLRSLARRNAARAASAAARDATSASRLSPLASTSANQKSSSATAPAARTAKRSLSVSSTTQARAAATNSSPSTTSTTVLPPPSATAPLLQVTTLANGVRVATDGTPGHFVAAGVYVGAGSRFEWPGNSGCSYMLDRMAFKSTKHRTAEQMTNDIENLGGQFLASSSREVIMYQASSYTQTLPSVMSLLSDTVLYPNISAEELEYQKQSAAWELAEINNKPDMILPELLYEVAFQGNTLGNPLLVREEDLDGMSEQTIQSFRKTWFRPDRMVVAGAGIPHAQLVELAEKHFANLESATSLKQAAFATSTPSTPSSRNTTPTHLLHSNASQSSGRQQHQSGRAPYATTADSLFSASNEPSFDELAKAVPRYTGGQVYDESRASNMEFSHLFIGYEGLSIHDPDVYALATLQMLLGGGSSFSAGGPGKGMFSRLYTNLLNRYHDVEHCSAFHHCYLDTGLFAMCISVNPHFISRAPQLIAEQLDSLMIEGDSTSPQSPSYSSRRSVLTRGITEREMSRAKNQLKSTLVMALESRMVQVEDLGRQVLASNKKVPIEEMLAKIDEVQLPDLIRVANRIFRPTTTGKSALLPGEKRSGEPSILAAGKLDGIPDVKDILRQYGLAP